MNIFFGLYCHFCEFLKLIYFQKRRHFTHRFRDTRLLLPSVSKSVILHNVNEPLRIRIISSMENFKNVKLQTFSPESFR